MTLHTEWFIKRKLLDHCVKCELRSLSGKMAESLVQSLLTKLGELALLEAQLQLGIGDDIKFIKDELSTMKAFLTDADRRSARGEVVSEWVAQVRDESFKVEDILDEFLLRMELLKFRKPMGCIDIRCYISYVPRIFRQLLVRHRFHSEIETIKKEIEDISKRREQYNLQEEGTSSAIGEETGEDLGAASPFVEEADIVGIEKDVKQLEEWLLNEEKEKQRAIISVVGMGGLGKTTLVKTVYKIIEVQFECHAWVYVSQTFNMTDILKRILEGFCNSRNEPTPSGLETMNEEELREKILIYLQRKRYVLVLDDIWDIYVWDGLKHALPVEGNGRIIFTTRMENVASPLNENYYIHKHEPLPHEIAWELFCKKAFRSSTPPGICPGYLKELADDMLRKCNGLPLAVVTLGGLMSRKGVTVIEWRDMLKNLDWELCHNQDLKRLNRVLITSYCHLPAYLKYCFLYCGMFPEDFEIDREKLIRLWVAEGFIEEHPRKTPEEVANECFMQLVDRSILQAIFSDGEGEIRACRMHDLMRDIAIYMFEKEEFAMIITDEDNEIERGSRRVAIQNTLSTGEFPSNMSSWNVRSFLIFNKKQSLSSSLSQVLWGFKLLRVLDLEGFKIQHLPEEIGDLIHLRYLGLKRTKIKELPASLEKLRVLQTLDVRYTNLRTLPRGIILLKNLRHLLLFSRHNSISLPTGSSSLKRLQTLHGVVLDEISARELNWLTQLRTLLITEVKGGGELCRELCVSINKMKHLRSLTISSSQNINIELEMMSSPPIYLQELTLEGTMSKFPAWFASLNCITKLNLSNSRLSSEPFSILSQLPNLQTLFLLNAYTGKKVGYGGRNGFWKLRKLVIIGMKELEEWREVEPGTLLNLRFIVIATCPKLMKLPRGCEHLTSLESLELGEMPVSFVDRLRRGGEDHWMVKHIPRIKIVQVIDECLVFDFLT